jgi:hypothetical protein
MAVSRADCARSATRVVSVHMTAGFLLVVRGPTGAWSQHAGHLARPLVHLGGERCFTTMPVAGCFWLEAARSLGIRPFLLGPCRTAAHRGYHLPRRSNPLRTTYAPTAPCPGKRGQLVNLTGVFARMLSSDNRSTISLNRLGVQMLNDQSPRNEKDPMLRAATDREPHILADNGRRLSSDERYISRASRILRSLYFCRAGFSLVWVAFVYSFTSTASSGARLSALASVFLIAYPISDVVATLFDIRVGRGRRWAYPQYLNLAAGVGAAAGIATVVWSDLPSAITVFGAWAVATGLIQVFLAVIRLRDRLRGQWPMIISGVGSLFAGSAFLGWTGTSSAALTVLAQYSAGGAVWYILTAFWLLVRLPVRSDLA